MTSSASINSSGINVLVALSSVHTGVGVEVQFDSFCQKFVNINEACVKEPAALVNVMNDVTETWADAGTVKFVELFRNYECFGDAIA